MEEFTQVGGLGDFNGEEKGIVYRNSDEDYAFFDSPLLMRMADRTLESKVKMSPDAESDKIQHLLEAAELQIDEVRIGANNEGYQSYLNTNITIDDQEIENVEPVAALAYGFNSEAEMNVDDKLLKTKGELESEIEEALKFYGLDDRKWVSKDEKPDVNLVHQLSSPGNFLKRSSYQGRSTKKLGIWEKEPGLEVLEIGLPEGSIYVPEGQGNQAAIKEDAVSDSGRYTGATDCLRYKDLGTLPITIIDEFDLNPGLYLEFDRIPGLPDSENSPSKDIELVTPAIGYLVFGEVSDEDHEVVQLTDRRVEANEEIYSHGIRGFIPSIGSEHPINFTITDSESKDRFVNHYIEQNNTAQIETRETETKVSSYISENENPDYIQ